MTIKVSSINISEKKGTVKRSIPGAIINSLGLEGDAHAGNWHRQVSLLGKTSIDHFEKKAERKIQPGEFGENLILDGIDLNQVAILDRFKINDVILEVTQIGKSCHGGGCAIYQAAGECIMPNQGLFARVINSGKIAVSDTVEYLPRDFKVLILTLSDRAFQGDYQDRSGPRIKEILDNFFESKRWHLQIEQRLIPDDAAQLKNELVNAKENNVDIIFTTGGTGVGPRDITPDVVTELADKLVPGVMDHIRLKYGAQKPNALLSRSIVGILDNTIVYTLPGSVKAVQEYMNEIRVTMEHLVAMLHGLGH